MKLKIKPIIAITFFTLFSIIAHAQIPQTDTKIGFEVSGGFNIFTYTGKLASGRAGTLRPLKYKFVAGFNIGLHMEIPVTSEFYIQPGLLFITKGAKVFPSSPKYVTNNLEFPVFALFKPSLPLYNIRFLIGIGPYLGFGVGGNAKYTTGEKRKIEYADNISTAMYDSNIIYFSNPDAGADMLFGMEFSKKFSAQLNVQIGFANLEPNINGVRQNGTVKNSGLGISMGYKLR